MLNDNSLIVSDKSIIGDYDLTPDTSSHLADQAYDIAMNSIKEYGLKKKADEESNSYLGNLGRGVMASLGSTGAGIADVAVDAAVSASAFIQGMDKAEYVKDLPEEGYLFNRSDMDESGNYTGFDKELQADYYKNFYGYDDSKTKQASKEIGDAYENGDAIDIVLSIASNMDSAGELIAESVGEMSMYLTGTGLMLNIASKSNQYMEERAKTDGSPTDASDVAISVGAAALETVIAKLSFGALVSKSSLVGKAIEKIAMKNKVVGEGLIKSLGRRVVAVGGAAGTEALEESFQQVVQSYGEKYGTKASDEIWNDASLKNYFIAGAMGSIAGGGIKAGVEFAGGTVDTLGAPISTKRTRAERDTVATREARDKEAINIMNEASASVEEDSTTISAKSVANKIINNEKLTKEDLQVQQNDGKAVEEELLKAKNNQETVNQVGKIVEQRELIDGMPTEGRKKAETLDAKLIDLNNRKKDILTEVQDKVKTNPENAQEIKAEYQEEVGTLIKNLGESKAEFKKVVGEDWQELPTPTQNLATYFNIGTDEKASRVDIKGRQTFKDATSINENTNVSPLQANEAGVASVAEESVSTSEALNSIERVATSKTEPDTKVNVKFKPKTVKENENTRSIFGSINRIFNDTESSVKAIQGLFQNNTISEYLFTALDPSGDTKFAQSFNNAITNIEAKLSAKNFRKIEGRGAKNLANLILVDGKLPDVIKDKLPIILASAYSDMKQQAKGSYLNDVADGQAVFNEKHLQDISDSVYANAYVNAVGQAMLRVLNVDVEFDNNQDINKAMLETSLGMEIVDAMVGEGELAIKTIKLPADKDGKIKKRNQIVSGMFNLADGDIQNISPIVGLRATELPYIKGQTKVSTFSKGRDGKKPTPKLTKSVKNMESMEYNVDTEFLAKLQKDFTPEQIKKMMGWIDPKDVHIVQRESVVATNNQLHRAYGQGLDFISMVGKKSFGYTYKMASNGRALIEQSIFNPVTDKQFARALVIGKSSLVTPANEMNWKRAVVLHLGHKKIERLSDSDIEHEFAILKRKIDKKQFKKEDFYSGEGIIKYKAFLEARKFSNDLPVESTMFIEVDGLTNGTYFTMMNYVGDSKMFHKYRQSIGIFTEKDEINTVQKYFKNKGKDVYQMIGENFGEGVRRHFANPKTKTTAEDVAMYNGTQDYFLGMNGIMDTRQLAKDPVMTFNYLAGADSMARNIAFNMFNELLIRMASTNKAEARMAMQAAVFIYEPNISKKDMDEYLDNAELKGFKETPVIAEFQDRILDRLANTYGKGMAASIDQEFGSMRKVISEVSSGFDIAGETYSSVINSRVLMNTLAKSFPEQMKTVLKRVNSFGPNKPNSTSDNQSSSPLKANTQVDPAGGNLTSENIGIVHPTLRTYEAKGSSTIPKMNTSLDSDTIASPMGQADNMLNVYDAIVTSVNEISTLQDSYNTTLKNDVTKYNHIESAIKSLEKSIADAKAFSTMIDKILNMAQLPNEDEAMSNARRKSLVKLKEDLDKSLRDRKLGKILGNLKQMEKNAKAVLSSLESDGYIPNQIAGVSTELDKESKSTISDEILNKYISMKDKKADIEKTMNSSESSTQKQINALERLGRSIANTVKENPGVEIFYQKHLLIKKQNAAVKNLFKIAPSAEKVYNDGYEASVKKHQDTINKLQSEIDSGKLPDLRIEIWKDRIFAQEKSIEAVKKIQSKIDAVTEKYQDAMNKLDFNSQTKGTKNTRDNAGQETTVTDLRSIIDGMKLKASNMVSPEIFNKMLPELISSINNVANKNSTLKAKTVDKGSSAFKADVLPGSVDYHFRFNVNGNVDHDTRVLHELFHMTTVGAYRNTDFRNKHAKFFEGIANTISAQVINDKTQLSESELKAIMADESESALKRNYAYLKLKLKDGSTSKNFVAESLAILATDKEFRHDLFGRDIKQKTNFKTIMQKIVEFAKNIFSPMLKTILDQDQDSNLIMSAEYKEFLTIADEAMQMKHDMIEGETTVEELPTPDISNTSETNPLTKGLSIINKLETRMDKALHARVEHLIKDSRLSGLVKLKVAQGYQFMAKKYPSVDNNMMAIYETTFFKKVLNTFKQLNNVSYEQVHALLGEQAAIDHRATTVMNTLKNELEKDLKGFSDEEKSILTDGILRSDIATLWSADKELLTALISEDVDIEAELETRLDAMVNEYQVDKDELIAKTNALAKGMIHEEFSVDYTPNAYVMSSTLSNIPVDAIRTELMNDIDAYVSILALKESKAIPTIAKLSKKGLESILDVTGGIQSREHIMFQENLENKIKGYTVTEYKSPQNVTFVPRDEKSKYLADGWNPTGKVLKNGEIMIRNNLDGRYHGGIVPMVSSQRKGHTIEDSYGMSEEEAVSTYGENISPVYRINKDNKVEVYGYRYMMSKKDKMEYIGMRNDIDELLPAQLSKSIRHVDGNNLAQKILDGATLDTKLSGLLREDGSLDYVPEELEKEMKAINDKLMKQIKQGKPIDIFIAIPSNVDIANYFDPEILKLYEPISENTPVTQMFKQKGVRYVRKGMSDSMLGYKEDFIFDKRELRYAEHIWKGLISESKKNIVIKNPAVIKGNILSNMFILKTMGVKMFGNNSANMYRKEYFSNMTQYKRLKTLQAIAIEKLNGAEEDRVHLLYKRIDRINERIKANPLNEAEKYGIFQSITDEILADDVQGSDVFNADARKLFEFFEKEIGDKNDIKGIWLGDRLYNLVMNSDATPRSIKIKLKTNKSEGVTYLDVMRNLYLKEGTPAGNAAIMLTQEADQASRWILFRHIQREMIINKEEEMKAQIKKKPLEQRANAWVAYNRDQRAEDLAQINREAGMIATNAFVDYREMLPREMKWLSTYGFWKFITFSIRIQGTLWRMAYDKPMRTLTNSATLAFLSEGRSFSPFNSNLISGSVYGTSLEPAGVDMIQPGYLDIL